MVAKRKWRGNVRKNVAPDPCESAKKEALKTGLLGTRIKLFGLRLLQLATNAANTTGTHHVDQVANMLNAGHMPYGFLNELLQVERRQLAGQYQCAIPVLDKDVRDATAKMRMMF